jgi:hypothetical protein
MTWVARLRAHARQTNATQTDLLKQALIEWAKSRGVALD